MQGNIPISVDDRRFTFWNWLGFLCGLSFFAFHFAAFTSGMLGAIWERVRSGDFTDVDLIWAVGLTMVVLPALAAFYALICQGLIEGPFTRGSVLLDTRAGRLILKRRHITGFLFQKLIPLVDICDLSVAWNKDEDDEKVPQLVLIPKGTPVCPMITNPTDVDDLPALAVRLRVALASAGWSDPSAAASAGFRQANPA